MIYLYTGFIFVFVVGVVVRDRGIKKQLGQRVLRGTSPVNPVMLLYINLVMILEFGIKRVRSEGYSHENISFLVFCGIFFIGVTYLSFQRKSLYEGGFTQPPKFLTWAKVKDYHWYKKTKNLQLVITAKGSILGRYKCKYSVAFDDKDRIDKVLSQNIDRRRL